MMWVASTATGNVAAVEGDEWAPRRATRECAASLCALARARVPRGGSPLCAVALAIAAGAGREIDASEAAVCVECGLPRSAAPREPWLRSWTGEPLCAECGSVLELDGELKAFAALAPTLTDRRPDPVGEAE